MEDSYGEAYYDAWYDKIGVPYDRSYPHWLRFFGNIAKNIMYAESVDSNGSWLCGNRNVYS